MGQSNERGDGGIYIGSIMKGGAVAADGRIEPGDMLLQVCVCVYICKRETHAHKDKKCVGYLGLGPRNCACVSVCVCTCVIIWLLLSASTLS